MDVNCALIAVSIVWDKLYSLGQVYLINETPGLASRAVRDDVHVLTLPCIQAHAQRWCAFYDGASTRLNVVNLQVCVMRRTGCARFPF